MDDLQGQLNVKQGENDALKTNIVLLQNRMNAEPVAVVAAEPAIGVIHIEGRPVVPDESIPKALEI